MLPTPKKFFVSAGSAEGTTTLTAFDNALLAARVGNWNLLRVSSILPPGAKLCNDLQIPPGSLVPTAYGCITSEEPGQLIAAAVGVGFSGDDFGVIMEHACIGSKEDAAKEVEIMLKEAFAVRGMELKETKLAVVEHRVVKIACALAAVPMWY